MLFRVADPDGRYTAVRLCSDLAPQDLARDNGEWRLELDAPVERLEYQLEVEKEDGGTETILDPGNPRTAPGAFGDKSVALRPSYEPPAWLEAPAAPGETTTLELRGMDVTLWSPAGADPDEPLPLLVAHDGPEFDKLASLTRFAAAHIAANELPPHRLALLPPRERDEWYSASPRYTRMLLREVLPELPPSDGPPAAMGASLGALALLHAQVRHPGTFRALFLQSGSFFMPRYDAQESRFPYYHRVVGFVREIHRTGYRSPVPMTLTCGEAEENIHNNRAMAETLGAPLHEVLDTHNYTAWRDALHPHLTHLLQAAWVTGRRVELYSPAIGSSGAVMAYGHWGRPLLVFPAEGGSAADFEGNGLLAAVSDLVEGGRVKVYSVDSFDSESWSNRDLPTEERARNHERYESWIVEQVVPHIQHDAHSHDIATAGISLGAFHAVNIALRRADVFPLAMGFSGNYDPSSWHGWGERGDAAYFNNPLDYLEHAGGDHLDWLRGRLSVLLVCGQGQWEDTTGSLESTRRLAGLLDGKGIPHELDLWGHDVPHDWPSWRAQLAHHLPRFC